MTQHTPASDIPDGPDFGPAALQEWSGHVESIMRGIAHALNNRAAALSAVIELSAETTDDPEIGSILKTELDRMRHLAQIVRVIGVPRRGNDAFSPRDAANEATAVLNLHGNHGDYPATIGQATATPVRVPRWMFVRSLVALAAAASEHCKSATRVDVIDDGDWIVARVEGLGRKCGDVSPYAEALARAMGGEPLAGGEAGKACGFRVPSLAGIRLREAR
jgi:hypothetical protein